MTLPPFPTDDQTLDLLDQAVRPGPHAERSSVAELCALMSELAGADPTAVEAEQDGITIMRDPEYHPNDIIAALVDELRRVRKDPR